MYSLSITHSLTRPANLASLLSGPRLHDNLNTTIRLLVEHLVVLGSLLQGRPVRDDESGVDLALVDEVLEEPPVLLAGGLGPTHLHTLLHKRADVVVVSVTHVHAHNGDAPALHGMQVEG
jgi:hypothetical protein